MQTNATQTGALITGKAHSLCRRPPQFAPTPCKLTFDLLTVKVVSESRVTWAISVPILSLPRPLCSRLRPDIHNRRQTDIQTSDVHHRLMPLTLGAGHNNYAKRDDRQF